MFPLIFPFCTDSFCLLRSQFESSISLQSLWACFVQAHKVVQFCLLLTYWLCWSWMAGSSLIRVRIIVSFCWSYRKSEVSHTETSISLWYKFMFWPHIMQLNLKSTNAIYSTFYFQKQDILRAKRRAELGFITNDWKWICSWLQSLVDRKTYLKRVSMCY